MTVIFVVFVFTRSASPGENSSPWYVPSWFSSKVFTSTSLVAENEMLFLLMVFRLRQEGLQLNPPWWMLRSWQRLQIAWYFLCKSSHYLQTPQATPVSGSEFLSSCSCKLELKELWFRCSSDLGWMPASAFLLRTLWTFPSSEKPRE